MTQQQQSGQNPTHHPPGKNLKTTPPVPQEIVSFYYFTPLTQKELTQIQQELGEKAKQGNITGLVLLSTEGLNVTLAGPKAPLQDCLTLLEQKTGLKDILYKRSPVLKPAFKKLKIKIKKEIITFGQKNADFGFHHLEPEEWSAMLNEQKITLLDIRNDYEVAIGQFKNAIHLNLKEFGEFSKKLPNAKLPKEQKTLLYCTGGVRCEKAILEMRAQGFKELYQLKGGIVHYLKSFPHQSFKGECFVFDRRVAVDQNLNPSKKYVACPHCGQAGGEQNTCVKCGKVSKVCAKCLNQGPKRFKTCSKHCANQLSQ